MQNDFRPPKGSAKPTLELKQTSDQTEPATSFQTPEQVSQFDETVVAPSLDTPRGTGHHWFNLPWPPTKQELTLAAAITLIAIASGIAYGIAHKHPSVAAAAPITLNRVAKTPATPAPVATTASLSGLPADASVNQRPVVGVMIENSQTARPQSGLSQAGVIFEAMAEGGITRFLALYQDQQPTNIGPVRSARPYFVQWAQGFDAAYVHVGGSPDALNDIKTWGVQNFDQFANPGPFHRISSRPAPHNLYSSVVDLTTAATQKGYKSSYSGFARKIANPLATPTASSIDFSISSALYNSHFAYDKASNTYLRAEGGVAQTDANTGKQLAPSVVIGLVVPLAAGAKTAQGGVYSDYNPLGSGQAYIFQDGDVTIGSWHKANNNAQLSFTDAQGAPVRLNPGQTWLTALSAGNKASYH